MMIPLVGEDSWREALRQIPHWQPPAQPTVVIVPHPDDETLGAGGLIAAQRRRGVPVTVIAVTDGEAAYPDGLGPANLGAIRTSEQTCALAELGVAEASIHRLYLADSAVTVNESVLFALCRPFVTAASLLLAPARFDFHPDHEACGRVAERLAGESGATLVSYMFWSWHRGTANLFDGVPLRRFELDPDLEAARWAALQCHRSQLTRNVGEPILPESLLGPIYRTFESYVARD